MAGRWRSWPKSLPGVADLAVAASAAVVDLALYSTLMRHGVADPGAWLVVAFIAAGALALLARRRHPVAVFVFVWLCGVLAGPVTGHDVRPTATPCVALFTVAMITPKRISVTALLSCGVPALLAGVWEAASRPPDERGLALPLTAAFYVVLYSCVWTGGRASRLSRLHTRELEFRQRIESERAVLAERTRIARELHDIVAHSVTVMVLQAAGARRVLATDPARVEQALAHIEEAGEQTMGELRRMLTALRWSDRACRTRPDGVTGGPQPRLADVDDLVHRVAAAGVRVHTRVEGRPGRLAASVDLAAYRVVQEALTNVTKHVGPGATVELRQSWGDRELTLDVADDGRGQRPDRALSTHHGLSGLRERLEIVGGRLTAEQRPAGGFRLTAVLPVAPAAIDMAWPPAGGCR